MKEVTILALLCLFLFPTSVLTAGSDGGVLVCYMELWAGGRTAPYNYDVNNLPADTCDYLVLIYLTMNGTTNKLRMHNGYTDVVPADLRKAAESRAKSPDMKVLLSVGGWEDGAKKYSQMMSEKSSRKTFIRSVIEFLEEYQLDGLELHWIYPGALWNGGKSADKDNYVKLVKELKIEFWPRKWILTASVPANEIDLNGGFDVPNLNSLLDHFHLRTFDLRGDWDHAAENHSPLYGRPNDKRTTRHRNVNDSIALWMRKGANPRKIIPVFPLFGRSFTLQNPDNTSPGVAIVGPGHKGPYTMADGILAYFEICDSLKEGDMKRYFDSISRTPFAVGGSQWVGYDDEESLKEKATFIADHNLPGAGLFAISLDDFTGNCGQNNTLLQKMRDYLSVFPDPRDLDE